MTITLASALGSILVPQQHLLIDARNAICAGDRDFVYTIDGAGSVAWAYPPDWEQSELGSQLPEDYDYRWIEVDELPPNYATAGIPSLTFQEKIIDLVLAEYGRPSIDCPVSVCYDQSEQIPVPLRPPAGFQAKCCLPRQTKVPSVTGGKFSVATKSTETGIAATEMCALTPGSVLLRPALLTPPRIPSSPRRSSFHRLPHPSSRSHACHSLNAYFTACFCRSWNPACGDTINSVAYYINLLQGSMSTAINRGDDRVNVSHSTCGGRCDGALGEICRINGQCAFPDCQDVEHLCHRSSIEGVRARQICPHTCGCDQPQSPLALFLPESGCPDRCHRSTTYRDALAATPCEDVPLNHSGFTGFLEQWYQAAQTWPKDWLESGIGFIDMFQLFGCEYLNMTAATDLPENFTSTQYVLDRPLRNFSGWPGPNLFWPANFGVGVNPCVTNGYYYPVKPLSFFCPVSCGCRGGDIACPDTCPKRFESSTNADGQVDHSGLEPNPSPRNVPNFPWRYS